MWKLWSEHEIYLDYMFIVHHSAQDRNNLIEKDIDINKNKTGKVYKQM